MPSNEHDQVDLDDFQVYDIRSMDMSDSDIADFYQVDVDTISDIRSRKTFKHLPPRNDEVGIIKGRRII